MGFGSSTKRFRRDTYNLAARLRVITYVCESCGLWGGSTKPAQCKSCGSMAFLRFDSKAEAERWATLRLFEAKGMITDLERQRRYSLDAHSILSNQAIRVGHYVADFSYFDMEDGTHVVEDLKGGSITDLASWKLKHFHAQYGFEVKLVKSGN